MISLIFVFGLLILTLCLSINNKYLQFFVIFKIFFLVCYIASNSENLNDIQVYRDAFYSEDKFDLYFEVGFKIFLLIFGKFDFSFIYAVSMGLSALLTYIILMRTFTAQHKMAPMLFILLYSPQFILAWRQALMYPALLCILLYSLNYLKIKSNEQKYLTIGIASAGLLFHSFGIVGIIAILTKISRILLIFLIFILLFYFIYYIEAFMVFIKFFTLKFQDGDDYIDDKITSVLRQSFVVLKFILLYVIFLFSLKKMKLLGASINSIKILIILKIAIASIAVFHLHPVFGRINGILSFVDFYVILLSSKKILPLSVGYALASFLASIVFNPYYNS